MAGTKPWRKTSLSSSASGRCCHICSEARGPALAAVVVVSAARRGGGRTLLVLTAFAADIALASAIAAAVVVAANAAAAALHGWLLCCLLHCLLPDLSSAAFVIVRSSTLLPPATVPYRQPLPAAVLSLLSRSSITFAAPVDGWLLCAYQLNHQAENVFMFPH